MNPYSPGHAARSRRPWRALGLRAMANAPRTAPQDGFTLIELLVVMAFAGILAAIAAPSWSNFANSQSLGAVQDGAVRAMREAQSRARQTKGYWSTCFRNQATGIEYAVQRTQDGDNGCPQATWKPLMADQNDRTEIANESNLWTGGGNYYVQYDRNGWIAEDLQGTLNEDGKRLAFQIRDRGGVGTSRSCVYVQTLLGALRVERDDECQ